jgi:hypothetical protein
MIGILMIFANSGVFVAHEIPKFTTAWPLRFLCKPW